MSPIRALPAAIRRIVGLFRLERIWKVAEFPALERAAGASSGLHPDRRHPPASGWETPPERLELGEIALFTQRTSDRMRKNSLQFP